MPALTRDDLWKMRDEAGRLAEAQQYEDAIKLLSIEMDVQQELAGVKKGAVNCLKDPSGIKAKTSDFAAYSAACTCAEMIATLEQVEDARRRRLDPRVTFHTDSFAWLTVDDANPTYVWVRVPLGSVGKRGVREWVTIGAVKPILKGTFVTTVPPGRRTDPRARDKYLLEVAGRLQRVHREWWNVDDVLERQHSKRK